MRLIDADAFKEQLESAYEYTELGEVIEMLDNAPTVVNENLTTERPHGEWIPVSERLPEDDMDVIFSIYDSEYCDPDIGFVEERLIVVAGNFQRIGDNRYWSWVDEYGDAVIKDEYCKEECGLESFITAWMPLPKPYEKEEQKNESDNNNSDNMRNIGDDLMDQ